MLISYLLPKVTVRVNKALVKRLNYLGYGIKNTTQLQLADFILAPIKLGRAILD